MEHHYILDERVFMMSVFSVVPILLVSLAVFRISETVIDDAIDIEIFSESGKSDYVLLGESANLTCEYALESEEEIEELQWSKDGELVYLLYPYQNRKYVKEGFVGTTQITPHTLIIPKVEMEMHGKYSCYVETDYGYYSNDANLTVIVDACADSSLVTRTQIASNIGTLELNCVGIFPEPQYKCEMSSGSSTIYQDTHNFNDVTRLPNGTFEVHHKKNITILCGDIYESVTMKCYITVPGSGWTRVISEWIMKKGCSPPPPIVGMGNYSVSEEHSCWGDLQEGSVAKYYCEKGFHLYGPHELLCRNGTWIPSIEPFIDEYLVPYCAEANAGVTLPPKSASFVALMTTTLLLLSKLM